MERLASTHGRPKTLFVDHGPEFTSKALDAWAHRHGVPLVLSRPGTPTDHPFIEAFNARFREECLNPYWLMSIEKAQTTIKAWRVEYGHRPGFWSKTHVCVAQECCRTLQPFWD
jgi:putative transposase